MLKISTEETGMDTRENLYILIPISIYNLRSVFIHLMHSITASKNTRFSLLRTHAATQGRRQPDLRFINFLLPRKLIIISFTTVSTICQVKTARYLDVVHAETKVCMIFLSRSSTVDIILKFLSRKLSIVLSG